MRNSEVRGRRGFTLLEVMIALTVVTASMVGLFSTILHLSRMNATNAENLAAMRGAEKMIETMKNTEFGRIFATYNASAADDPPPGPGTAPGPNFDVEGLVPRSDDPDGKCGKILFPTGSGSSQLREDTVDRDLMMPRDLNGNGKIDGADVAATYTLLPVTIQIDWQGIQGHRSWIYRTILLKKH